MRRRIAIFLLPFFLFGMLFPIQVKEDLAKLPFLLSHFQQQKKQFPETTFFQFLSQHYGSGFASHNNAHDHTNLPLKSNVDHIHLPEPALLPVTLECLARLAIVIANLTSRADQFPTFLFCHDIWQPPRV